MRRAIREHLTDFIAIAALLVAGLAVTAYILSQQQQPYPSWVPSTFACVLPKIVSLRKPPGG